MKNYVIIAIAVLLMSASCAKEKTGDSGKKSFREIQDEKPVYVKALKMEETDFNYDLLSNGTVSAMRKADLKFETDGVVSKIYVKNGMFVKQGQLIAELDRFKLEHSMIEADGAREKAYLELQDVLISQGYSLKDSANVPPNVMKIAKIRSGYMEGANNLRIARHNLEKGSLRAPFSGAIANLNTKVYNNAGSETFCTVVDNRTPEVVFKILESEISLIRLNDKVQVSPFSSPERKVQGQVSEINPVIDANGMVQVKATVSNPNNTFYDGMNVQVKLQRLLGKRIVVPKSALLLRTNRKVIFTLKHGKAIWNYVETAQENSDSYVVTDGIHAGDSVICDGNLNLAHESPVIVNK
jgi:membrane fusion protein, multidrug efflux system